jgi:hypothetical protein
VDSIRAAPHGGHKALQALRVAWQHAQRRNLSLQLRRSEGAQRVHTPKCGLQAVTPCSEQIWAGASEHATQSF